MVSPRAVAPCPSLGVMVRAGVLRGLAATMGRLQSCKRVQWVGRVSVHIQGAGGCRCVLDGPTRRGSVKK